VSQFNIGGDTDDRAQEKGVLLLGECGLDPGIDSMSAFHRMRHHVLIGRAAMRILDRVRREGKKVTSFVSWCGGLPEPSASNVRSPLLTLSSLMDRYLWDTNSPGHQKQSSQPPSIQQVTSLMINYILSLGINFWHLTLRMYHYGKGWHWRVLLIGIHYLTPRNMGWEKLGISRTSSEER
jgi:hypothetical protein